jgi:hypothetical protein
LLDAVDHHNQSLTEALDNADLDDELKQELRDPDNK